MPETFAAERAPRRTRATSSRLLALDGLRGVAATVVLLHHAFLTVPGFAAAYFPGSGPRLSALTDSPLHVVAAGPEAVLVFFVLSGFVLVRSTHVRGFTWRRYYPQRILRIYVPLLGALVVAAVLFVVRPPFGEHAGPWLSAHDDPVTWAGVVGAVTLAQPVNPLNSVLWTLRLEVAFSLVLPIVVLVAGRLPRSAALGLLGGTVIASGVLSVWGSAELRTLPAFAAGALLARIVPDDGAPAGSRPWWRTGGGRPWAARLGTGALWIALLVLLTAPWWCAPGDPGTQRALFPLAVLAAVTMVWATAVGAAPRWLSSPLAVWSGGISFSLYLVHEPLLVTVTATLPGQPWAVFVVGIPLSVVAAACFRRWWERPAQRFAKRVTTRP